MDDFFDKAKEGFQKTVETISKKSSEFVAITQCKSAITVATDNMAKNYEEIGRYIYEAYADGHEFDEFINNKSERIKELQEEIDELKEKLSEIKNIKECPTCGNDCNFEAVYCSKCGYRFYESHEEE